MNWQSLISTFGLIFIAELGDKTQLAVMTQTCKYRCPWPVFLGGSLALTTVTALGALGGQMIAAVIPDSAVRAVAAAAFVVMGILIWREAAKTVSEEDACGCESDAATGPQWWNWPAFGATFTLLFFAELGDKTQLAVLGLASKQPSPWVVFAGGVLALTAVTALGVIGGRKLCEWIPERTLLRISAAAFIVMGALMAVGVL